METIGHRVFSTLVLFAFLFLAFIVFLAWIAPDHVSCDPACQDRQLGRFASLDFIAPRAHRVSAVCTSSLDSFSGDTDPYTRPTIRLLNTKIAGKVFRTAQYV